MQPFVCTSLSFEIFLTTLCVTFTFKKRGKYQKEKEIGGFLVLKILCQLEVVGHSRQYLVKDWQADHLSASQCLVCKLGRVSPTPGLHQDLINYHTWHKVLSQNIGLLFQAAKLQCHKAPMQMSWSVNRIDQCAARINRTM